MSASVPAARVAPAIYRIRGVSVMLDAELAAALGRKMVMMPKRLEAARKLLASGMATREITPAIGVSVTTLYRHFPAPAQEAINAEGADG